MKIDTSQIQDFFEKSSPTQPNSTRALPTNDDDVSLQVNFQTFVDEATQASQVDAKAVQQAQELLLSGQLESPENIEAAAENIIKFGI